jgi:hypothetical protein
MPKNRKNVGQPIGFLSGQAPQAPNQSPYMRPPMPNPYGNAPSFPYGGGSAPSLPAPQGPQPKPPSGLGGFLQGLSGGSGGSGGLGDVNIPELLGKAQKMIGAVNQAGAIFKNMSPMLQMLKGLNVSELLSESDDSLTELEDNEIEVKPKRRRKRRKRKTTRRKRRR